MTKPGIAAYFQCWKHPHATIQSLKHYRKCYPNNTVYLLSDNGYDYSELAKEYNCIYEHSNIVHGGFPVFTRLEDIKLFLDRFLKALYLIEEDWVLLLEDDTIIFKPYNINTLQYSMNGINIGAGGSDDGNRIRTKPINDYIKKINPDYPDNCCYSCWGGCVLSVPFFRKAIENYAFEHISYLWNTYPNDRLTVTDIILSFIGFVNKGSVGHLPGLGEAGWGDYFYCAINTDKRWCGVPLEEDEKHLVKLH